MGFIILLFKLIISHALCDFALQTPWMAANKNRHIKPADNSIPKGQTPNVLWPYVLSAHALIHAGGVWVATGSALAAAAMFVLHWVTDFGKCENWSTIHMDQALHLVWMCAIAYVVEGLGA